MRDIGALLDWIDTREDLDSTRVAVWGERAGHHCSHSATPDSGCIFFTGGSYGGYMCLASLIHYPTRFCAGIITASMHASLYHHCHVHLPCPLLEALIWLHDTSLSGIDMVGISNFVTFLENTAAYRR